MNQRNEANSRDATLLYEFAMQITQLDLHQEPSPQLGFLLLTIFGVESIAIFDADLDKLYQLGEWGPELEDSIRNAYFFESSTDEPEIGLTRRVLRIGELAIGAIILRGEISPLASSSIACLVAITFDRYHSLANVSRTASARQAEQLRTTVLDSLAHAYKTPLTAILAATSGLHEMGGLSAVQSDLVQLIDEQTRLLNDLTTRLLKTAEIDAREMEMHKETIAVGPMIDDVIANLSERVAGLEVRVNVERDDMAVRCDRELMESLLTQFIDNAGKFATTSSTITIEAAEWRRQIVFSVHNVGPVIAQEDQERVFDRFFRCAESEHRIPGTGIGLSVAKHVAQAHGGDVWLTSDLQHGTTFFAALPKEY